MQCDRPRLRGARESAACGASHQHGTTTSLYSGRIIGTFIGRKTLVGRPKRTDAPSVCACEQLHSESKTIEQHAATNQLGSCAGTCRSSPRRSRSFKTRPTTTSDGVKPHCSRKHTSAGSDCEMIDGLTADLPQQTLLECRNNARLIRCAESDAHTLDSVGPRHWLSID